MYLLVNYQNFNILLFAKMITKSRRPTTLKYSILKPNQLITSLRSKFYTPRSGCGYELAQNDAIAIRRYTLVFESLENFMQDCQWRYQETGPIVPCLYLQLLPPQAKSGNLSVEIYVQDLELTLLRMKKLIIPEALYMIMHILRGFRIILEKFGQISLKEEAIGLNSEGRCRVWINNNLALNTAEDAKMAKPEDIARAVIRLVQSKSQPAAHALLAKILEKKSSKEHDLGQEIQLLAGFVKSHQIKIPQNLKYLVYQDRLCKKLSLLESRRSTVQIRERIDVLKTPRFIPQRRSLFDYQFLTPKMKRENQPFRFERGTEYLRRTADTMDNVYTSKSFKNDQSIASSVKFEELNGSLLQSNRVLRMSNAQQTSVSRLSSSRGKSQSFQSIRLLNLKKPKKENRSKYNPISALQLRRSKRNSGYSLNSNNSTISNFDNPKHLNCSLFEIITAKRLYQDSSSKFLPLMRSQQNASEETINFTEASSMLLHPDDTTKPSIPIKQFPVLDEEGPTFQLIPEAESIIKANNWKTTLTNLLSLDSRLKTSIVQGHDTNVYLADVYLQKLGEMGKTVAESSSSYGNSLVKPTIQPSR